MDFDYKKYSLGQLENWMHDALSCSEASPQEIYDTIKNVVNENYYIYKDHTRRCGELLGLLNGNGKSENFDDELYKAALAEREYYEGNVKYDSIEQIRANHKKSLTCDKDDKSPKCQKAWNDFWEENYYPEEHNKSKPKKWVLPVDEVQNAETGEYECFVTFPDDLLEAAKLKEGDQVEWVDQGDGSYLIKKITNPLRMDEC